MTREGADPSWITIDAVKLAYVHFENWPCFIFYHPTDRRAHACGGFGIREASTEEAEQWFARDCVKSWAVTRGCPALPARWRRRTASPSAAAFSHTGVFGRLHHQAA